MCEQASGAALEVGATELLWHSAQLFSQLRLDLRVDPVRVSLPVAAPASAGGVGGGRSDRFEAGELREPLLAVDEVTVGVDLRIARCAGSHAF